MNQVALLGGKDIEDGIALAFAELLDHGLFGRLGGNAAQLFGIDGFGTALSVNLSRIAVDGDLDLQVLAEVLFGGQLDSRFNGIENQFSGDVLFAMDQIHAPHKLSAVHG